LVAFRDQFFDLVNGPTSPGFSGLIPSRSFFNIAFACNGISGRLQASCAGDKSSVLVSPVTLKTVILISSGTSLRLVNHSASAQDCKTAFAFALPAFALSATSWNASNTRRVFSMLQQLIQQVQHIKKSTKGATL
jgi:hypothetical protein